MFSMITRSLKENPAADAREETDLQAHVRRGWLAGMARRRQKGMTIDQMLLYIVLAGLIVGLGVAAYSVGNTMLKSMAVKSQRNAIVASVRGVFQNRPTYSGLTNQLMLDMNRVPSDMVDLATSTIVNRFGGAVTLTSPSATAVGAGGFDITFEGMSKDACQEMVQDGEFLVVTTDGGINQDVAGVGGTVQGSVDQASAEAGCPSEWNTVTWTYN